MPFIGRTPTPVPLTSSDIPDSIITDAKIVGMTSSKLSGALPAISGASLTGISSSLVKTVGSSSSSSASSVTLTNCFTSSYDRYLIFITAVNVTAGQDMKVRYIASSSGELSSNYRYSMAMFHSDNSTSFIESQSTDSILLFRNGSGNPSNGTVLEIQGVNDTDSRKMCSCISQHHHSSYFSSCLSGGGNTNTEAITGLKFFFESGDLESHTITCFGVAT